LNLCLAKHIQVNEVVLVAVAALLPTVGSHKLVAGFIVVEVLLALRPMNQLKGPPDVFPVTLRAVSPLLGPVDNRRVVPVLPCDPASDLGVALRTDEDRLSTAKNMALRALQRRIKFPVSVAERSRRKLRVPDRGESHEKCKKRK